MPGTLVSGQNSGADFVALAEEALATILGFRPFHGTLNLENVGGVASLPKETISEDFGDPNCDGAVLRPCRVGGVRASIIRPLVPNYPENLVELLAPIRLRPLLRLEDGDELSIYSPDEAWQSAVVPADPTALDRFEAVVFDLDGTLVDLAVDWSLVHDEVDALVGNQLDRSVSRYTQNEIFDKAREFGVFDELVAFIESLETEGAKQSAPKPLIEYLDGFTCPIGICTANSRRSAELALERFDVLTDFDTIVARQTVRPGKPDPSPLLEAFDRLNVAPGDSVFVGDDPTDAQAAVGAGSSFLKPDQF